MINNRCEAKQNHKYFGEYLLNKNDGLGFFDIAIIFLLKLLDRLHYRIEW